MGDCNCKSGNNGSNGHCVECDITQMARNNYFTGKLLVERDFTDEQQYTMGKLRRHNQRLHGWGAVCGLKVEEHPNPSCQAQYVIIEPGYAVDCCGREILVSHQDYFDFAARFLANWQTQNGANSQPDTKGHTIQICVSYKECATESVPALFDDCSPGSCQPNRILESHDFDVVIDPKPSPSNPQGIELAWGSTIGIGNVVRVVENDASSTLFALASSGTTATLYAVDTTNGSVTGAVSFAKNTGLDVQISPAGDFLYVALQPTSPSTAAPQILVIKTSALATTVNTLTVTNSKNGDALRLAVVPAPDGRLLSTVPSQNTVLVWNTDIQTTSFAAPTAVSVGTNPADIAIDSGSYACVANSGSNNVTAIALSGAGFATTAINAGLSSTAVPSAVAVATTTAGDTLAVLDKTNTTLYLISIPSAGPGSAAAIGTPVTTLSNTLLDVGISPGGRWVYVLEADSSTPPNGYLQVVDAYAVATNQANFLGSPIEIAIAPENEALSGDGTYIYVPYAGNSSGVSSGIAVIDATQDGCPDLFQCAIEHCPDCSEGNCVVLATIKGYVYNTTAVTDALIDNLADRHLLVSTDLLTDVVRCILAQGTGGGSAGTQGPPGQNGSVWYEGITEPPTIAGNNNDFYLMTGVGPGNGDVWQMQGGTWTKVGNILGPQGNPGLNGINGTNGTNGLGLETQLTRINALSWTHAAQGQTFINIATGSPTGQMFSGLVVAFSGGNSGNIPMPSSGTLDPHVFEVTIPGPVIIGNLQFNTECQIPGTVYPVSIASNQITGNQVTGATIATGVMAVNGIAFVPNTGAIDASTLSDQDVRVYVRGDYILDTNNKAICCEFVRAQFPTGEIPAGQDIGLEGGVFYSWFTYHGN